MTETELSRQIAALPKNQVDRQQQRTKRSQRKYQGQQKDDRLLSLVRLPGYFPYMADPQPFDYKQFFNEVFADG